MSKDLLNRAGVATTGVRSQIVLGKGGMSWSSPRKLFRLLAVGAALLLGLTAGTAQADVCTAGDVGASCNTCFDCNDVECCIAPPQCIGWIPGCEGCKTICRCVNPDACAPDCNNNGVGDPLDISGGTSGDCNLNGVPDDCEPDCNSNGLADECEIPGPTELYLPAVTYPVGADPVGLAFGDLDNDGDLDMVAGNQSGATISVRLNNGSGSFGSAVTYTAGGQPRSVAIGDLDGDGDRDVAVINNTSNNVGVFLNNGNGTLAAQVTYPGSNGPYAIAAGDVDGDTDLDLISANFNLDFAQVFLNNGNGGFVAQTNLGAGDGPSSVAVADLNGANGLDLVVANFNSANVSVLLNNGVGGFANDVLYPAGNGASDVAIGDFDGMNGPDLAVSNQNSSNVSVLRNNGSGTFAAAVNYATGSGRAVVAADLDNDGHLDLATANAGDVSVLLNNGNGTFAAEVRFSTGVTGQTNIAAGDLNRDTLLDLAVPYIVGDRVAVLLHALGDCNGNGVPDECEDCNTNGLADTCDMAVGLSDDCNTNGVPDECELAGNDCNNNGRPDECDLTAFQLAKLTAADAAGGDVFGSSVSVSGGTAIVGAELEDHAGGINAGSAYVLVRSGGVWSQQAKLTAADAGNDDSFGVSVSVSGDTAIVGAYADDHAGGIDAGSAYVFVRTGGAWSQQAKLTGNDTAAFDGFGISVSVSGDTAIVGAQGDDHASGTDAGSAYVFVRDGGGAWSQQAKLIADDAELLDRFGTSVSISGDTAIVGAYRDDHSSVTDAGSAYVFVRSGGLWSQQAKLTAADAADSDRFGISVSVSGDTAIVGARFDDDVANDSGSAYVFVRSGGVWSQQAKLTAADAAGGDEFGTGVSISGDTAIVGANFDEHAGGTLAGSAYVFVRTGPPVGGSWSQQAKLTSSDAAGGDSFGISVSVSGDTAIVGAYADNHAGGTDAGSAYTFSIPTSTDCDASTIPDECDVGFAYKWDDGSGEIGIGLSSGGSIAWMNHFVVQEGAETIRAVSLAWRSIADGVATDVYLWSDPNGDGDPSDAQVIASATVNTVNSGTDILTTVPIPATYVGPAGASFFAGALLSHDAGEHPASIDQNSVLNAQSWFAGDDVLPVDPNDLASGSLPVLNIDSISGLQGNWLIRARTVDGVGIDDCDIDGLPDACEPDCNANDIPDACDISAGTSEDCNASGIPDECELAAATSADCDGNGVPDECDADCNLNGVPDGCDLSGATSDDCNTNGTPDECDVVTALFGDGFEAYAAGSQLHRQGGWKGWENAPAAGALVSTAQAYSAAQSVDIVGASDLVHEFSGATAGRWTLSAWQYLPPGYNGDSFFIALNTYADNGTKNWSTEVHFDSAADEVVSGVNTLGPLVTGAWVPLRLEIDLDADTQTFYYGDAALYTKSWTDGATGGGALNIAALDLWANGATSVFYDNISLTQSSNDCDTNGVPDDCEVAPICQNYSTVNASNSTTGSFHQADDFIPANDQSVASIEWWGSYLPGNPGADSFVVTYFNDGGGFPGTVLAGPFTAGVDLAVSGPVNTGDTVAGNSPIWAYLGDHPNVAVSAGTTYWIEIRNTMPGGTRWFWVWSPDGNNLHADDNTPGNPYAAGDIRIQDLAFCLNAPARADCNTNGVLDECEPDTDGDGMIDECDACAGGAASGDGDAGGAIDLGDYSLMNACPAGPGAGLGANCECFDFDGDGDTDLEDFAAFQVIFGP